MHALPILDPCREPWETMRGDDRARHCASCDRRVYDLSARTESQAQAVLALLGGQSICVRYETDPTGAIRHAPREPRRAALAAGVIAAALVTASCAPPPPPVAATRPEAPAPTAPAKTECASGEQRDEAGICVDPTRVDRDGDRIPDAEDACPNAPGPPSHDKSRNGCPHLGVVITQGEVQILQAARFVRGSSKVSPASMPLLADVAALLRDHPEFKKVAVVGHASSDERGAARLGEARARAVIAALANGRVDRERLVAESGGSDRPIASNVTVDGREKNRRVEFRILDQQSCPAPAGGAAP